MKLKLIHKFQKSKEIHTPSIIFVNLFCKYVYEYIRLNTHGLKSKMLTIQFRQFVIHALHMIFLLLVVGNYPLNFFFAEYME